jgi:ATP-dependent Clp protease ATP-binding subunit ClpC
MPMWARFSDDARRAIFYAQEEAARLGESFVSTEHLLLALTRDSESAAARVLQQLGVIPQQLRFEVERRVSQGPSKVWQETQLTPRAKRVIDLAYEEARHFNDDYVGTEHLLLGLIREAEGLAGQILKAKGIDLERARVAIKALRQGEALPTAQLTVSRTDVLRGLQGRDLLSIERPFFRGVCRPFSSWLPR